MTNIPPYIVYHVRDIGIPGEADAPRASWTKVGAAWQHSDGKGLNILLETVPLDGRLIVRTAVREDNQSAVQRDAQ
jgi:hypothetical protein